MVEVRLHGPLVADYGRVWNLDIASPGEAVAAINANRPGFSDFILALDRKGLVFRVRSKAHDYDDNDITTTLGSIKRIDIIPIVRGASAGMRFVTGAILVVAGFMIGGPAGSMQLLASQAMVMAGASLMIGSVVEWLTSMPRREDATKSLESWTFNGAANSADQGLPVPIIYGEVLTGGYPISAGINASQVTPTGAIEPLVTIGGDPNPVANTGGGGFFTMVVTLSAGPFNIGEPYSYSWTVSGFAGAVQRRITKQTTATVRVELDYNLAANLNYSDTGTVSVTVSGKDANGSGNTVQANASQAVRVSINTTVYVPEFITCFPAGAKVLMADGSERRIETILPGDYVMGVNGPAEVTRVETPKLGGRRMLGFADGHLWSEEHPHWTRDVNGNQWWWTENKTAWLVEAACGAVGGLFDNDSMRDGDGYSFAHLTGWKRQRPVEIQGFDPQTQLYMPVTDHGPIVVDGYLVAASTNEARFDYKLIDWNEFLTRFRK